MLKTLINAVIGNSNQRLLKKYSSIVKKINELEMDIQKLKDKSIVDVITPAQLVAINGRNKVESIDLKVNEEIVTIETDFIIPLYGLIPKMNIFKNWGLNIEKNAISVNNALDYSTNIKGIYAIGDINHYPGKLKLIL